MVSGILIEDQINEKLSSLQLRSELADQEELMLVANEYWTVLFEEKARNIFMQQIGRKFDQLNKDDLQFYFDEFLSERVRDFVLNGKLKSIRTKNKALSYWKTGFYYFCIDKVNQKKSIPQLAPTDSLVDVPSSASPQEEEVQSVPFYIETLQMAFSVLCLLSDPGKEDRFPYLCARLKYRKDQESVKALKLLFQEKFSESELKKKYKSVIKSLDPKCSNLFRKKIRKEGLVYYNNRITERPINQLSNTSPIIRGILFHFYHDYNEVFGHSLLERTQLDLLMQKVDAEQKLFQRDGVSIDKRGIRFTHLIHALWTVFKGLEDRTYVNALQLEFENNEVANEDFIDLLKEMINKAMSADFEG